MPAYNAHFRLTMVSLILLYRYCLLSRRLDLTLCIMPNTLKFKIY